MMIAWLAAISCLLAVIPGLLFIYNLTLYLPSTFSSNQAFTPCSVLIPARNEESTIARSVCSVLQNSSADLEVLVFDDGSVDRTAQIVQAIAAKDPRVHLVNGRSLPAGWCGKQHACYQLARLARYPRLVFMDADVRLTSDALSRMCAFLDQTGAALASGIPCQETVTFSERLLVPLIHFVLLGFLPIRRMRSSCAPAYGAGCGQLFVVRREAYFACGGHSAIRGTLHDGLKLPAVFRTNGFHTDLFDATNLAVCRMYSSDVAVWRGFAKNAHEALASPILIGPATLLLVGGQVLPPALAAAAILGWPLSRLVVALAIIGTIAAFLPRWLALVRFRQSLSGALLHPIGVCGLVVIQWYAFLRARRREPTAWKGRTYPTQPTAHEINQA